MLYSSQLSGTLRLVMKPLINQMPMIGGVQYFFLNPPSLEFNLIGVADVFDMPGLSDLIRRIVSEQISNMYVSHATFHKTNSVK